MCSSIQYCFTIFHGIEDLEIISEELRLVIIIFNVIFTQLFIGDFKIVPLRFRNFLLHYRYMDGILTVVRT
jgi:hypothetical protein